MHPNDTAAADIEAYFRDGYLPVYGHASSIAALVLEHTAPMRQTLVDGDTASGDLVLERLPNGELAWLRPAPQPADEEPRYVLTDHGRRALAMAALFDPIPHDGPHD